MNVYVAGRFTKKDAVREAQKALRDAGHVITFDWTGEDADGMTGQTRLDYLARSAELDMAGVRNADAILLLHDDTGRGLFVELGMALADSAKLVVIVGGLRGAHPSGCVFYYSHRCHHFCTVEGAVKFITEAERP